MFVHIVYLVSFILLRSRYFSFEAVNSHLHLFGCGYHNNHIDGASLDVRADDAEDDYVAHYVEYYD
jgi:hypothetical protein